MQIILWNDDQGRVVALTPPGGMTAEQAKKDGALVPQDRPSFIVDNATMPNAPLVAWRLSAQGAVTVDEGVPPPRIIVSRLRFKLELLERGLLANVDAAVAAAGATAQLYWAEAIEIESDHPLVQSIAQALQLSPSTLRAIFEAARDRDA